MSKKTNKPMEQEAATEPQLPIGEIEPRVTVTVHNPQATIEAKPVYDFSHGRRCPRCQTTDTHCRSTQGGTQYRLCLRAVCKHKYAVVGKRK